MDVILYSWYKELQNVVTGDSVIDSVYVGFEENGVRVIATIRHNTVFVSSSCRDIYEFTGASNRMDYNFLVGWIGEYIMNHYPFGDYVSKYLEDYPVDKCVFNIISSERFDSAIANHVQLYKKMTDLSSGNS